MGARLERIASAEPEQRETNQIHEAVPAYREGSEKMDRDRIELRMDEH
jgi:hypothetical protein